MTMTTSDRYIPALLARRWSSGATAVMMTSEKSFYRISISPMERSAVIGDVSETTIITRSVLRWSEGQQRALRSHSESESGGGPTHAGTRLGSCRQSRRIGRVLFRRRRIGPPQNAARSLSGSGASRADLVHQQSCLDNTMRELDTQDRCRRASCAPTPLREVGAPNARFQISSFRFQGRACRKAKGEI